MSVRNIVLYGSASAADELEAKVPEDGNILRVSLHYAGNFAAASDYVMTCALHLAGFTGAELQGESAVLALLIASVHATATEAVTATDNIVLAGHWPVRAGQSIKLNWGVSGAVVYAVGQVLLVASDRVVRR